MTEEYVLEKYGFPEGKTVKLNPYPRFKLGMELSEEKQRELEDIFKLKEAPLVPLLEDIVRIVNDSIECNGDDPVGAYLIKKAGYKPTGKETTTGACVDAGRYIRKILCALRIEGIDFKPEGCGSVRIPNPEPERVLFYDYIVTHDCTVVCDENGKWVVLNSKSTDPNMQFYVVPREGLIYMGPPFVPEAEYQRTIENFLTLEEKAWLKKMDRACANCAKMIYDLRHNIKSVEGS